MSKKNIISLIVCFVSIAGYCQKVGIKTNLAYGTTATFNLGAEVAISHKSTIDFTWGYNPWTFSDNKKWKHWLVMPEYRYYLCEAFNGHFFGLHAGYTEYNIGGIPMLYHQNAKYYRYQGWATGTGISYGYQWILGNHWNLEATAGFGVIYTEYDKYIQNHCGAHIGAFNNLHYAPTKIGINITYFLR